MKFKLISGTHLIRTKPGDSNPLAQAFISAGDVIESSTDLSKQWVNKFVRLPEESLEKVTSPKQIAKDGSETQVTPPTSGKDVELTTDMEGNEIQVPRRRKDTPVLEARPTGKKNKFNVVDKATGQVIEGGENLSREDAEELVTAGNRNPNE